MNITMTKTHYELKEGTKNAWKEVKKEVNNYTETQYRNYIEAAPFFRRLGGSEYLERAYTYAGYKVVKVISKSPDRREKKITTFEFKKGG